MKNKFSKNIIISLAIHILCIAGFIMLGFQTTHNPQKISSIKPNEMVFTLETAYALTPPSSKKETVNLPPKIQKTIQKNTPKKPAPKIVKKKKPKLKKRIVKKAIYKPVKTALHTTKKQSLQDNKAAANKGTQAGIKSKNTESSVAPQPNTAKTKFNPKHIIAQIKNKIARNKYYPNSAKRRGIEGRVGLQLSVSQNGTIQSLHIINSSGSKILDKAAIKSVRHAVPFIKMAKSITFKFFMKFNLENS